MQIKLLFKRPARTSVVPRAIRYRERFEFALAISLLLHALILALRFGAAGFGLPWFDEERPQPPARALQRSDVVKMPEPSPETAPVRGELAAPPAPAAKQQKAAPSRAPIEVRLVQAAPPPTPAPVSAPRRETSKPAPAAKARAKDRQVKPKPAPRILAQAKPDPDSFKVPAPKRADPEPQRAPESAGKAQAEETRAAEQPSEQARREPDEAARAEAEEEARQRALREAEAKKVAEARRQEELRKQEDARREEEARKLAQLKKEEEAKKLEEAKKIELARKEEEAKKLELAKKEEEARKEEERRQAQLKKEEEARKVAQLKEEEAKKVAQLKKEEEGRRIRLEIEALKRAEELARMQAEAKRKADEAAKAKEAAERQRAEAEAAAQRDRERLARKEGPLPAPGALSGQELAQKAIEQFRQPGALRGIPEAPQTPGASPEKPRRRSLIGIERDVSLRAYVDSWRWKIERGGNLNYRVSASMRARENPIVTVAIRSDGTLEQVQINRSSGNREIDQAVRRIAELYAPYSKFPPDLARQYDVIEIRRVWFFDDTLKILDEM